MPKTKLAIPRSLVALAALLLLAVVVSSSFASRANAQQPTGAGKEEDLPIFKISGGVSLLKLALPQAEGDREGARLAHETMSRDMDVSGLFQVLDPNSFP